MYNFKYTKIILFLLSFFVLNNSNGMEEEDRDLNKYLRTDEISIYLRKELLLTKRYDPLVFKLITHDRREVYIVGSVHDYNAESLLPPRAFKLLTELHQKKATLFTEHSSLHDHLIAELSLKDFSHDSDLWKPEKTFDSSFTEIWNEVKDTTFPNTSIEINNISKLSLIHGCMLFYTFALRESAIYEFEPFLRKWEWRELYLETVKECLNSIAQAEEDAKSFFNTGLVLYKRLLNYKEQFSTNKEQAFLTVLQKYKNMITTYNYEAFKEFNTNQYNTISLPMILRNEDFSKSIANHLATEAKHVATDQSPTPLLIVCGAGHLYGILAEGCGSFLKFLWDLKLPESLDSKIFISIERMGVDGNWKKDL